MGFFEHCHMPPNSIKITLVVALLTALKYTADFLKWPVSLQTNLFYLIIVACILLFILNLILQYSLKVEKSKKIIAKQKKQIKKLKQDNKDLNKTSNNLTQLYNSSKEENQTYANTQSLLEQSLQNKNKTFSYYMSRSIDLNAPDTKPITILNEMRDIPGIDKELINAGDTVIQHKLKARKEIDAIEATEENKDGQS
ncbi:hypothetical protein AYO51_12530 [Lactiplantibacillus plantarum]|uniref:hypothetical protein n=1 Tax=Lactiplantibacillus plantarum TaxID=1590 RepID=UPI0007887588|nr:hypothetical protein [Lactiplantibacillus plantarum]KYK53859.1 hypothetical protein AYO51_12530 [Lactiplantibacillus plantarum]KYM68210.1 hypothetical protein AZJ01_15325 [Lactiplantibacillus plantarum]